MSATFHICRDGGFFAPRHSWLLESVDELRGACELSAALFVRLCVGDVFSDELFMGHCAFVGRSYPRGLFCVSADLAGHCPCLVMCPLIDRWSHRVVVVYGREVDVCHAFDYVCIDRTSLTWPVLLPCYAVGVSSLLVLHHAI